MVDQQTHGLGLSALDLPLLAGEPDVASQVRDTNCSAQRAARAVPPSAPLSEDEVDQDDDDEDEEDELGAGGAGAAAGGPEGNETGSSGRPGRGVKRKKAGKGGNKRNATPVRLHCCGMGCEWPSMHLPAQLLLIGHNAAHAGCTDRLVSPGPARGQLADRTSSLACGPPLPLATPL